MCPTVQKSEPMAVEEEYLLVAMDLEVVVVLVA